MTWFTNLPRSDPNRTKQAKQQYLTQLSSIITMSNSMILFIVCFLILSVCCCFANSHESNYYYYYNSDGDAIQVKNSQPAEEKHDSLLPKDFFSVFSNEIPILNSVENQSLNENTRDQLDYFNSMQTTPNQIPIVKFSPPELNFGEQFIGVPRMQTVNLVNIGLDYLRLESISGSTVHFYCSFFADKIIPAGGNTSFDVYYLARELGTTESALFINTNKGIIKYKVNGVGIRNPFKLKPILNARIPINTSFTSQIVLHNPLNVSLQINEMFSSDDDLHIELSNQIKSNKIKISDFKLSKDIWNLKPYETRQIALVHYIGRQANNHTAFICIQTNLNHTFVIPFELEVTKQPGLFSPLTLVDFGDISIYESSSDTRDYFNSIGTVQYESERNSTRNEKSIDLYLMNNAKTPVKITDVFSVRNNPALKISYLNNIILPPDTSHLTKVAQLNFDPTKSNKSSHNYGKILVKTNNTNITFQIGFNADLYKGSIEYEQKRFNYFVLSNEPNKDIEQVNSIDLLNSYSFPIVIYSVHLNERAQKYFEIDFKGTQLLKPNKLKQAFKLKFLVKNYLFDLKANSSKTTNKYNNNVNHFYALCSINTNFSHFQIPIHIYDGQLALKFLNEDNELISDLNLGGLSINSVKDYKLQIDNYNPIDINLDNLEIKNLLNEEDDNDFRNEFDLKFLYYEQLSQNSNDLFYSGLRIQFNKTYLNDQIKNNLKLPAHHRMVIGLTIKPTFRYSNLRFISSDLFKYELNLTTKYESKKLQFHFRIVNGALDLVNSLNQKQNRIDLINFPTQITKHPVYIKSSFETNLEIQSIEFLNYGNVFLFRWSPHQHEPTNNKRFGLIQAKNSTQIGNLYFDSRMLCEPNCYSGLNEHASAHLYDLWLHSLTLSHLKLDTSTSLLDTFDLDYSLIQLAKNRYQDLMQSKAYFSSSLRFQLSYEMSLNDKSDLFSYSFPIRFDFKQPRLTNLNSVIQFPLSQVHTTTSYHNLTLVNPSSSSLLMQIMFLNNYPQKHKLLNLIHSEFEPDYSLEHLAAMSSDESSAFSLHVPLSYQQFSQEHQQIAKNLENEHKIAPNKNSFVLLVPAYETRTLQIKYKPTRLGHFEDMVVIRNNLTVLDAFMIRADAGTAELTVNNMAPMRNSLFFDGVQSDVLAESTSDLSNLVIEMSKEDFANCDAKVPQLTEHDLRVDALNFKSYLEKLSRANELNLHEKKAYRTAYRSEDGILLRSFFVLKNSGTTELYVYAVLFDGEPCYSRGIELAMCESFSVQPYPNNTYLLEVRYRPDFTMSLVRKSLTVTTNIGDLEYLIEVKIPHYMLSACHDSLPRPEFEEYFYYVGSFLIVIFICIMLVTSMFDSSTLMRRKPKVYASLVRHEPDADPVKVAPPENLSIAQIIAMNNSSKRSNQTSLPVKTPPASPKAPKNSQTAKAAAKPPAEAKKILNASVTKKLKEKDNESDSSVKTTTSSTSSTASSVVKSPIIKQNSTPIDLAETILSGNSATATSNKSSNQLTRTVSLNAKTYSPPMSLKQQQKKQQENDSAGTEAPAQKKSKNSTNEIMSTTRRNYLIQQNISKPTSDRIQNKKQNPPNKTKIQSQTRNASVITASASNAANKPLINLEPDLEDLNNQFKQIQQQNKKQLKETKEAVNFISNQSNLSFLTPINSQQQHQQQQTQSLTLASASSSSLGTTKKIQNDLFNILLNTNQLEQEKPGEFSRSMSILSKRSTSSLSGILTPGDSVSRSDSPLMDFNHAYFNQSNAELRNKLNVHSNVIASHLPQPLRKSTDESSLSASEKETLEDFNDFTIINHSSSFNNPEDKLNSRSSPLSLSSGSVTSDLWVIPNKFNVNEEYDFIVQGTEEFKNNFHYNNNNNNENFNSNRTDKTKFNNNKTSNKRPINTVSPNSESIKESLNNNNNNKFSKKNQNNLKPSISAPAAAAELTNYYDTNRVNQFKQNITQTNSLPFTTASTKQLGPIQRPNQSYQTTNSNNINNNITNNLYLTLPPNAANFAATQAENDLLSRLALAQTISQVGTLDQFIQLTGDDLQLLRLIAVLQECNNVNNTSNTNSVEDQYFNFLKLNAAATLVSNQTINSAASEVVQKNDLNSFGEFNLFGADLDKEKHKINLNNPFGGGLVVAEEETSYWPTIEPSSASPSTNTATTTAARNTSATSTSPASAITANAATTKPSAIPTSAKTTTASNQPWNSVLLNDFDEPSSLTGTSSSAIRNLWSKDASTSDNNNENNID